MESENIVCDAKRKVTQVEPSHVRQSNIYHRSIIVLYKIEEKNKYTQSQFIQNQKSKLHLSSVMRVQQTSESRFTSCT